MKIGIDISNKNISVASLTNNNLAKFIDETIYDTKRESNRAIMEKVIRIIRRSTKGCIKSIGLSLPSKLDDKRGVVYDLMKIPYWKGYGIKNILEDEFHARVWPNNDVNCFMLAEKHHGICKNVKDALCITLGPNIGISIMLNGKLFMGNKYLFNNPKCMSLTHYDCIRIYRNSFIRTIGDLVSLYECFEKEPSFSLKQEVCDELGVLVGRLVSILLCNYDPEIIVLGGTLARFYVKFADSMDNYLEKFIHPHILMNLIVSVSEIDHPQALGAASLSKPLSL